VDEHGAWGPLDTIVDVTEGACGGGVEKSEHDNLLPQQSAFGFFRFLIFDF
jgi:hypothetical protein